jgi:riboflavin kinase/FMN adenylyltransferase
MKVLERVDTVPAEFAGATIALGNFDGVHRGHQKVIGEAVGLARDAARPAGVMTFEPHPRRYFQPKAAMFTLTPTPQKLKLIEALGADFAGVLAFDQELAGLSGERFVCEVLADRWQVGHLVVGYNFFFGKGRSGSPQLLADMGPDLGFGVTVVAPESDDGEVFSSSAVRDNLRTGDVRGAAEILGYWWTVRGIVESGAGIGRGIGYPTANVVLEPGQELHHGIYAVRVGYGGRVFDAAGYLGRRPTFDNGEARLEVYLFEFDHDLYGQEIAVELIAFIRPDQAFESPEALVRQMDDDCARARGILARVKADDPMERFVLGRAHAATRTA